MKEGGDEEFIYQRKGETTDGERPKGSSQTEWKARAMDRACTAGRTYGARSNQADRTVAILSTSTMKAQAIYGCVETSSEKGSIELSIIVPVAVTTVEA